MRHLLIVAVLLAPLVFCTLITRKLARIADEQEQFEHDFARALAARDIRVHQELDALARAYEQKDAFGETPCPQVVHISEPVEVDLEN